MKDTQRFRRIKRIHRVHYQKACSLIRQVCGNEVRLGCEVGIWKGDFSQRLLLGFPFLHLVMVDCWGTSTLRMRVHQKAILCTQAMADRRIIMHADSILAARFISDESLDFGFIDACHTYEAVAEDTPTWWRKVKRGGLFFGDDYVERIGPVGKEINEGDEKEDHYGVKQAVDEFAERVGIKIQTTGRIWWCVK